MENKYKLINVVRFICEWSQCSGSHLAKSLYQTKTWTDVSHKHASFVCHSSPHGVVVKSELV